jgi:acetyl esterase/lipase
LADPVRATYPGGFERGRLVTLLVAVAALLGVLAPSPPAAAGTSTTPSPCLAVPGVTCVLNIPYIDDGSPAHTLDAYFPTNLVDRASIMIIHGGRWQRGSSSWFADEATYFAENGFAAFSINYTLGTKDVPSWPQVRRDVESATAWVMSHAQQYHGDDARVGVLGGSSGGHLAALVDTDGPDHGAAPRAAVSWSGAMDLTITYKDGNGAARNGIHKLLGCKPNECPHKYAIASPVTHVSSGDGRMLFFHSRDERIPIAGAREMDRALRLAKVPHTFVVLRHSTAHAREYECTTTRVAGYRGPVIDTSLRWLGTQLAQPTTPTGTFCT